MADTIVTVLKLMGQRSYVSGVRAGAVELGKLDVASAKASRGSRVLGASIAGLATPFNIAWAAAKPLTAGLATLGTMAAVTGLKFDAGMEQAQIGMKTLLRNGDEARKVVKDVRDFALRAPLFGVQEMVKSAQQLIGTGFDAKKIVPTLTSFSDTLSALGRNPEDLQRMTYAFMQMSAKGQISAEELRGQLGEIFPATKLLARGMGISMKDLNKQMKKGAIKSAKALPILLAEMNKEYGGATQKQSQTFNGMLANLKEGAKYTLGIMFKPLFTALKKDVFPALNTTMGQIQSFWSDNALTTKQKIQFSIQSIRTYMGPLAAQIGQKIKEANLGKRLTDAIDYALPIIMDHIANAAPKAALAFATAWWHAGVWAKLFIALGLASKLGLFNVLGRSAAEKFSSSYTKTTVAETAGWKGKIKVGATNFGMWLGRTIGIVAAGYMALEIAKSIPALNQYSGKKGWGELWRDLKHRGSQLKDFVGSGPSGSKVAGMGGIHQTTKPKAYRGLPSVVGHQQSGGWASGWNIVGERGPELVKMPNRSYVYPTGTMPPVSMPSIGIRTTVPVIIRGREVARAVADDTADVMART
jgi:tape measure domain-containing protein